MDAVGLLLLALAGGFLTGFAPGSSNSSAIYGLLIGLLTGAIVAGTIYLLGSGMGYAMCILVSSILGGYIAAVTPNSNPIKRYFNLEIRE